MNAASASLMLPYVSTLLAVINASDEAQKALALQAVTIPDEGTTWTIPALPQRPGRPAGLREGIPARRRSGLEHPHGRLRFLHAIYHIELSAIDLAVVAGLRGSGMPAQFHVDWIKVASDEAEHAGLISALLRARGYPPGSEAVHHRLWDSCRACADLGDHLVIVPRVLEARGLDVNAGMLPRLAANDPEMHAVMARIYHDEIRHVAVGTHWQRWWCQRAAIASDEHFRSTGERVLGDLRSPFALDRPGRRAAGFSEREMDWLDAPTET